MEWLSNLFSNTLGSNGIGGGLASLFSSPSIPAANLGDAMNSGTLMFDETTNLFSDGLNNIYSMNNAGDLFSGAGRQNMSNIGSSIVDLGKGVMGVIGTPGGVNGAGSSGLGGLGGLASFYSAYKQGDAAGRAADVAEDTYHRDTTRLAAADKQVADNIAQSKRVWGTPVQAASVVNPTPLTDSYFNKAI